MAKIHGRYTRLYVDGYDISGDFNSFEPGYGIDVAEVSGFGDATKKYVTGLADPRIRANGLFNDSTAPAQEHAIATARIGSIVMLDGLWGTGALQQAIGGSVSLNAYAVAAPIGGAVTVTSEYGGGGTGGLFEFLQTLLGKGVVTNAGATGGVDTGGTFPNGVAGHLQFFNGTGTVQIQSGTTVVGPWTTRISFPLATAPYGNRQPVSAPFNEQFLRAFVVGTGTAWVGFDRV